MSIERAINSISSLSASEQIQVVNAIWGNLPEDISELMPVTEQKILEERLAKFQKDPTNLISEEELKAELKKRKTE